MTKAHLRDKLDYFLCSKTNERADICTAGNEWYTDTPSITPPPQS